MPNPPILTANAAVQQYALLAELEAVAPVKTVQTRAIPGGVEVLILDPDNLTPAQMEAIADILDTLPAKGPPPDRTPYRVRDLDAAIDARFDAWTAGQRNVLKLLARAAARVGLTKEDLAL